MHSEIKKSNNHFLAAGRVVDSVVCTQAAMAFIAPWESDLQFYLGAFLSFPITAAIALNAITSGHIAQGDVALQERINGARSYKWGIASAGAVLGGLGSGAIGALGPEGQTTAECVKDVAVHATEGALLGYGAASALDAFADVKTVCQAIKTLGFVGTCRTLFAKSTGEIVTTPAEMLETGMEALLPNEQAGAVPA